MPLFKKRSSGEYNFFSREINFTKIFREIDFTEIAKDEKSKIKTWRTQIFSFYANYKTVFWILIFFFFSHTIVNFVLRHTKKIFEHVFTLTLH